MATMNKKILREQAPDLTGWPENAAWLEEYDNGVMLYKNANGQVAKSILPPEVASEIGASPRKVKDQDRQISDLLTQYGIDPSLADAKVLAAMVVGGRSYSLQALTTLRAMAGFGTDKPVSPGERCPTCGNLVPRPEKIHGGADVAKKILAYLEAHGVLDDDLEMRVFGGVAFDPYGNKSVIQPKQDQPDSLTQDDQLESDS